MPLETVFGGSLLQSIETLFFRLTSHVRWNVFPNPLDLAHISIREREPADRRKMFKFRGWQNCPSHSGGPTGLFTAKLAVSSRPCDHSSLHSGQNGSCYRVCPLWFLPLKQSRLEQHKEPPTKAHICSSLFTLYLLSSADCSLPGSVTQEANCVTFDQVKLLLIRIQWARWMSRFFLN